MATFTRQDRQRAVKQTLSSWAIEGFAPDEQYLRLLDRYIDGELTLAQVRSLSSTSATASDRTRIAA